MIKESTLNTLLPQRLVGFSHSFCSVTQVLDEPRPMYARTCYRQGRSLKRGDKNLDLCLIDKYFPFNELQKGDVDHGREEIGLV